MASNGENYTVRLTINFQKIVMITRRKTYVYHYSKINEIDNYMNARIMFREYKD